MRTAFLIDFKTSSMEGMMRNGELGFIVVVKGFVAFINAMKGLNKKRGKQIKAFTRMEALVDLYLNKEQGWG